MLVLVVDEVDVVRKDGFPMTTDLCDWTPLIKAGVAFVKDPVRATFTAGLLM
jgi:hypothetical protein